MMTIKELKKNYAKGIEYLKETVQAVKERDYESFKNSMKAYEKWSDDFCKGIGIDKTNIDADALMNKVERVLLEQYGEEFIDELYEYVEEYEEITENLTEDQGYLYAGYTMNYLRGI